MDGLSNALAIYYQPEEIITWGDKIENLEYLSSIQLHNFGELDLPLSTQDVLKIQELYSNQVHQSHIDQAGFENLTRRLSHLALSNAFQIDLSSLNINIQTTLASMVIRMKDEEYEEVFNYRKGNGVVGNILLQLPVYSNSGGGLLSVNVGSRSKSYNFEEDSNTNFYLAGIFGSKNVVNGTRFKIQPARDSPIAVMIFNVVWIDSTRKGVFLSPCRFPGFLKSAQCVSQILQDWKSKETGIIKTSSICVPLVNDYQEEHFDFSHLQDADSVYVEVIKSINCVELGLAVLKKINDSQVITVQQIMFEPVASPKYHKQDPQYEIVGELGAELIGKSTQSGVSYHPALLIRLKNMKKLEPRKIDLVEDINQLRKHLFDAQKGMANERTTNREIFLTDVREIFETINEIMTHDIAESEKSWIPNVLRSLLDFCCRLEGIEEGVMVLDLVLTRLPITHGEFVYSEGEIQKGLNEYIVEFICSTSGWEICSAMFFRLIQQNLSAQVLHVMCDLASKLLQCECYDGAYQIIDKAILKLSTTSVDEFQEKNLPLQIKSITDLVNELGKIDSVANRKRFLDLKPVFLKLNFSQVCKLLEQVANYREDQNNFGNNWLLVLSEAILECPFDNFNCSQVSHLTTTYNYEDELPLVKSLWIKLCFQIAEESYGNLQLYGNNRPILTPSVCDFFVTEITLPERSLLLDAISDVPQVRETFNAIIEKFVKKSKRDENSEKILAYYSLIMFADRKAGLADDNRVDKFCSIFSQLSSDKLCNLNWKMFDDDHYNIKHRSTSVKIFTLLCNEILSRDIWTVIKSSEEFPEVASNIIWMKDPELTEFLLAKIYEAAKSAYSQQKPSEIAHHLSKLVSYIEERDKEARGLLAGLGEVKICSFLYIWYNSIIKVIQEKKFEDTTADSFYCVLVRFEKRRLIGDKPIFDKFAELATKIPLITLKKIIISTFAQEIEDTVENIKNCLLSWKIYQEMTRRFINHPILDKSFHTFLQEDLLSLMQIFFWLGEAEPIITIGRLICLHPLRDASLSDFISKITSFKRISDLATASEQGMKTFASIIDHCLNRLNDTLSSKSTWAFPGNPGVQNAEVNAFLMSDKECASFGSYSYRTGAMNFGKRMITNTSWGIEYKPVLVGARFACEFVKTKQFSPPQKFMESVRGEINDLIVLRASLDDKIKSFETKAPKSLKKRTPLGNNQTDNIIARPSSMKKNLFIIPKDASDLTERSPAKRQRLA